MKRLLLILPAILFLSTTSFSQTREDSLGIKEAAFNYLEGWYEGNPAKTEKALHPDLAKRIHRSARKSPVGSDERSHTD